MMKYLNLMLIAFLLVTSCKEQPQTKASDVVEEATPRTDSLSNIERLIADLENAKDDKIMVVAHRGDWRNAPENSLQAIENCIEMGVDMVEIDIRETKDGALVLMHDTSIDRTTKATGKVKDWTLDSLKTLNLVDGLGVETAHKIPTLTEALQLCKGKILVNLDKSYPILDKCVAIAKETGTLNQIVIKGSKSKAEVQATFGDYLEEIHFMPIISLKDSLAKEKIADYMKGTPPVAFEFTVPSDTIALIKEFEKLRKQGVSVWVNSLWAHHNGGHDDQKAALNPKVYNWFVKNHINMIQTDRPELLLTYLKERKLHR